MVYSPHPETDPAGHTAGAKLKNIYRVLSTRGIKGTYFYFLNAATRRRVEEMMRE